VAGGLITGLGVAAAGLGVVLHFYAQSEVDTADTPTATGGGGCPSGTTSQGAAGSVCGPGTIGGGELQTARIAETVEIASFIAGGVLFVSGIALIIAAPTGSVPDSPKAAFRISPSVSASGGGLTLHW
jgi:hypothetical protein